MLVESVADLSNKTVLFWDSSGGYTHLAESVVGEFGRVLYFTQWEQAFPSVRNYIPGTGLDGIERVYDFFEALDDTDLVVFTDVGMAGLQETLRRQGMPVFGSGNGAQLERDRWFLKSICKKFNIDAADAIPVTGIENLRQILGEMEDAYVKMSVFRGDDETFHHEDMVDTARRLNELTLKMEPFGDRAEFVVEMPVQEEPCVEVGVDFPVNAGGVYPKETLWGYEIKDKAYAGRVSKLPPRLRAVVDKLASVLQDLDYRGPMSTETRECESGSYLLDFTARFPNPPSALMRFMVLNWAEIMWEGAHGRVVEPSWAAPIGVQIIFKSEYGAENPLRVTVDRWDRTVLYGHCANDGSDYAVSPSEIPECASVCGMGTTLKQALGEACEVAEGLKGRDLGWDAGALEELTQAIKTGEELDISWSG